MDVLKPDLQCIDGICYRINPGNYTSNFDQGSQSQYIEQDFEEECVVEEESEDEAFEIITEPSGRMKTSFHIAKVYFPYIIGNKGTTKNRIEKETRTKIFVPKIGETGCISVTGANKKSVCSARRRIHLVALAARRKQPPTHFISIPLVNPVFKEGFEKFKAEVLERCPDRGISEAIFQSPDKLHLTLCVLVLFDDEERADAAAALSRCKDEIIMPHLKGEPLRVKMVGVDIMNDDPSETRVLYGKVSARSNPEMLQELLNNVVNFFCKEGFIDKEREKVIIHATLMNCIFGTTSQEDVTAKRETFDATNVLKNFQDFYFGEADVTTFEISLMHSISKSGYYLASASVSVS